MDGTPTILLISKDKALNDIIYFCLEGWGYEVEILCDEVDDITFIKRCEPGLIIIDLATPVKAGLRLCRELKSDFVTKCLPLIVLIDRRQLRKHLLSLQHGIDDYLLNPPDPLDLRFRVEMALRRTQYSFHTNALTGLAGGRIIEEILKRKVARKEKFSYAYVDIDNFKYFNDRYGYIKGDRVITQTAYILHQIMKKFRSKNDFLGHIGGDDFVFITLPDREKAIVCEFIKEFDRLIPLHYSPGDRRKGYISVEDRSGVKRDMPLMSVSVAIVDNKDRDFENIVQINETLAEIKSYLKKKPGSAFMIERRRAEAGIDSRAKGSSVKGPAPDQSQDQPVKPLGQILLEQGLIEPQALEETLDIHWRRDLPLGQVLTDTGRLDRSQLDTILSLQRSVS